MKIDRGWTYNRTLVTNLQHSVLSVLSVFTQEGRKASVRYEHPEMHNGIAHAETSRGVSGGSWHIRHRRYRPSVDVPRGR